MNNRATLASFVRDFEKYGEQTVVVSRNGLRLEATSYQALASLAGRFSAALEQRGVHKGDRVVLWGENSAAWMAAFFGCILRGVLAVPLDVEGGPDLAARVAGDTKPKLIVGDTTRLAALAATVPRIAFEDFPSQLPLIQNLEPEATLHRDDPFQIIFTSGTTGTPKGVVHTHANVLASVAPIEQEVTKYLKYERPFHPIRFLHTLPLSHVFGEFMGLWIPPLLAAEVHFETHLAASRLIGRIHSERISVLAAVPRVLDLLRDHLLHVFPDLPARLDRSEGSSAWKRWWLFRDVHRLFGFKFWSLVCGGAALSAHTESFWRNLGFVVVQGYGMTETTALISLNHPFHASHGTVGKVLPGREIRIAEDGEVQVRGETISNLSWQNGSLEHSGSEWLPTGDLANIDAQGDLRFRGRKKEVIVTSAGLNIYPEDLEAALSRQPQVKACTIIERESSNGPEPLAVLILRSGEPETVVKAANQELAPFQQIRHWFLWPDLDFPRTSTGKIRRLDVARFAATNDSNQPPSHGNRIARRLEFDAPEGDLRLDSLGRVELQSRIEEQWGVTIGDDVIQQIETVGQLETLLTKEAVNTPALSKSADVYPLWPWSVPMRAARMVFFETVIRPLVWILAAPRVARPASFQLQAPSLLYANHVTSFDVPLLLYGLPGRVRRHTAVAMSGEMLQNWRHGRGNGNLFLNWLAPLQYFLVTGFFNVFPLPRQSGFRQSFEHAARAMDRGYHVIVFPEGHRAENEQLQPFRPGAGLLWNELRAQAVPIFLGGIGELKRTGSNWFHSGRISVHIGESIDPQPEWTPQKATSLLEQELHRLAAKATPSSPEQNPGMGVVS